MEQTEMFLSDGQVIKLAGRKTKHLLSVSRNLTLGRQV